MADPRSGGHQQTEPAALRAGGRDPDAEAHQRLSGHGEAEGQGYHQQDPGWAGEAENC